MNSEVKGYCGKCGAPYKECKETGELKPICKCWNLGESADDSKKYLKG
jgi:hypothetical protein